VVSRPSSRRDGDGAAKQAAAALAATSGDGGQTLEDLVAALAEENAQLQRALESRVVVEQAKGVLAERFAIDVAESFELLRASARNNRLRLHELAERVVASRVTPPEIDVALVRRGRARA
jgi:ANTAR domain-containing protein